MKIRQLEYVREVVRRDLRVSDAARALHTSQPGVSRQIRQLEEELGFHIFQRRGKRLLSITNAGARAMAHINALLQQTDNLRRIGKDEGIETTGVLAIATTHTQARYVLPRILPKFFSAFPKVRLRLYQSNPVQACEHVLAGEADLVIATEAIGHYPQMAMLPCYRWNRSVIVPPGHPLTKKRLSLEGLAAYPLITYDLSFTGRNQMNQAFAKKGLIPSVALTALDSDVIKTYVSLGLGVGIIADMAFDKVQDKNLRRLDASHLFEPATTSIGLRQGDYLRSYVLAFISLFAPRLTANVVRKALLKE